MSYAVLAEPCFELTADDRGDWDAHCATQEKLDQLLASLAREDDTVVLTVTRLTKPCAGDITCDACQYVLDEDDDGRVHVPYDQFAVQLRLYGWVDLGERILCPSCAADDSDVFVPTEGQEALPGLWVGPA